MNTKRITTEIAQAAEAIRAGQLVAVPTETVYGLAGNGLDPDAVAQIYEVKGRPAVKPLSLMVHDASAMARYCTDVPPAAYTLAEAFWPGPLTIVLRAQDCVPEIVRAGGETVGLRCPDHNRAVGGKSNSQHMYGEACDLRVDGVGWSDLLAYTKSLPGVRYAYHIEGSNKIHFDIPAKPSP